MVTGSHIAGPGGTGVGHRSWITETNIAEVNDVGMGCAADLTWARAARCSPGSKEPAVQRALRDDDLPDQANRVPAA
jgi:hypothetical protein